MRDINITKYRKLLEGIVDFCRSSKQEIPNERPKKILTDFERGREDGKHAAYNSVMKHIQSLIQFADSDWKNVCIRDTYYTALRVINYGPKYKVGQKVCAVCIVEDLDAKVHVNCNTCDSTGKIRVAGKDIILTCPVCNGAFKENEYQYKYKILYDEATIGRVEYVEYADKYKIKGKKFHPCSNYFLDETGVVCGGQIWNERLLFSNKKEAEEFCKKYVPSSRSTSSEPVLKT